MFDQIISENREKLIFLNLFYEVNIFRCKKYAKKYMMTEHYEISSHL